MAASVSSAAKIGSGEMAKTERKKAGLGSQMG